MSEVDGWQKLRQENRDRERAARKLCKRRKCRTCGRIVLENMSSTSERTEHGEKRVYTPNGTYGYSYGICTLRCGFRYAHLHAPKLV